MFLGTWVNDVRLQSSILCELSDGDTLVFGGQSSPGSPEFYFLFQKVKVRPLDFDAITVPKVATGSEEDPNTDEHQRFKKPASVDANYFFLFFYCSLQTKNT